MYNILNMHMYLYFLIDPNIDEIQQDLVKLGIDNERLASELQNTEKELLSEKRENEKVILYVCARVCVSNASVCRQ